MALTIAKRCTSIVHMTMADMAELADRRPNAAAPTARDPGHPGGRWRRSLQQLPSTTGSYRDETGNC